jgi:hypothetical protein
MTHFVETPNWVDWSNGSHEVDWDRLVYRGDMYRRRNLPSAGSY